MNKSNNKILIISQYFYPENFKINDLSIELSKRGYSVEVLTSIPNYPNGKYYSGYGLFTKRIECVNGIKVYRAFQTPRGTNPNGLSLAINYLSFALCASIWSFMFSIYKKYDYIFIFQPSPITQAIPALVYKLIKNIKIYLWVLDVWPEAMISGSGINNKSIISIITYLVKIIYKHSTKILISSKPMRHMIIKHNVEESKIIDFPNWADDIGSTIFKIPQMPKGKVIMMAGNMGKAQITNELLKSILSLKHEVGLHWVFIGDGSKKQYLDQFILDNELSNNVHTLGKYPKEYMYSFFKSATYMLVVLDPDFADNQVVVPGRVQTYMAASKPILVLGGKGACEDLIKDAKCGYFAENSQQFVNVIKEHILNNEEYDILGKNSFNYYMENFDIQKCMDNLDFILQSDK